MKANFVFVCDYDLVISVNSELAVHRAGEQLRDLVIGTFSSTHLSDVPSYEVVPSRCYYVRLTSVVAVKASCFELNLADLICSDIIWQELQFDGNRLLVRHSLLESGFTVDQSGGYE